MSRINLSWKNDSNIHSHQKIYKSLTMFDSNTLPSGAVTIGRDVRVYEDTDVVEGLTYYYAVATVDQNGEEYLSDVLEVEAVESDGDPYWDNVVALFHFDGPDGSDVAIEEKGILMSVTRGTPSLSSAEFKFGGTSWHTTNGRITSPLLSSLPFGVEDFTVEAFIMPTNLGARNEQVVVCMRNQPSANGQILALQNGRLGFSNGATWRIGGTTLSENVWSHIAVSREAAVLRLFVNGVLDGQWADGTNFTGSRILSIGDFESSHFGAFVGYIDELRITKGVARYTSNFIPPTKPFPNYGV